MLIIPFHIYLLSIIFKHFNAFLSYKMVIRRPTGNEHVWTAYTKEFHREVWLVLSVTAVVMVIVNFVVRTNSHGCQQHIHRKKKENHERTQQFSLSDSAILVTGLLLGQGMYQ